MASPDPVLDRFANEWLPLQLHWACSLDRGWPTGMRGGRDAANDFAALPPYEPAFVRELILTELSCQRDDGWVPRHFSARGHAGPERDRRSPVDAGAVVLEMVHAYLCCTRDWSLLGEGVPWLDDPAEATAPVIEHLLRISSYYLAPENIGEHGLCKVREGGWLDSLNKAGLAGRGEDVMLTCQVISGLRLLDELLNAAMVQGRIREDLHAGTLERHAAGRNQFGAALNEHAWNGAWYNGFFTDEGQWLFSDNDPDGKARAYGPACYWAVICGAAGPERRAQSMAVADRLRCSDGFLLHDHGFTGPYFPGGRMTSGDSPAGRSEHHNPYNHGSHGFLARAAATAGDGELLLEAL